MRIIDLFKFKYSNMSNSKEMIIYWIIKMKIQKKKFMENIYSVYYTLKIIKI